MAAAEERSGAKQGDGSARFRGRGTQRWDRRCAAVAIFLREKAQRTQTASHSRHAMPVPARRYRVHDGLVPDRDRQEQAASDDQRGSRCRLQAAA
eukprot:COSAG01_NODE_6578_length_3597_cov_64.693253_1_plen_95_part_00